MERFCTCSDPACYRDDRQPWWS